MDHGRFDYSPIQSREPLRLPGGARIAVSIIPNIEHFPFDKPSTSLVDITKDLRPDILNYSWRDYGARVGVFRLMEVMKRHGFRGTAALNASVCDQYPQIIEAGNALGWEWMGHGHDNASFFTGLPVEEERRLVRSALAKIEEGTGHRPRGWLSPALTETVNTLDILAEAGVEYVANWVNDDQPYPMRVKSGELYSLPYSVEINDIPAFLCQHATPAGFCEMITDQFDVLHAEGGDNARIMAISVHPFLIGQPFRSKHFERALAHIAGHEGVWRATGSEILDWVRRKPA